MNIGLISGRYFPHVGGVQAVVDNLTKGLTVRGHNVYIITSKSPWSLKSYEVINGIKVYRTFLGFFGGSLKASLAFPFLSFYSFIKIIKIIRDNQTDIANLHFVDGSGFYVLLLKRILKIPIVVSVHGNDVQIFPKRSRIRKLLLRNILKETDFVTGCSNSLLKDAKELVPEIEKKTIAIHNGINLNEFKSREIYNNPNPYIFAMARFEYKKGFDILVKAFKFVIEKFHRFELIIAGDGPEKSTIQKMVREFNLEKNVKLIGKMNRDEVVKLFNGCEFFVLSSRIEPFGIVNLEAMAAGKAIVATRVDGVPEIITNGYNGMLVEPNSPEELAKGIIYLIENKEIRDKMGLNGRNLVEEYQWDKVIDKYLEVYEKVMK
ncbi:MAG: glycosyltransferase family 4 protein [bacterium]|nr:glycosyltransferase family 4 protein [bacterium]